jgi:DNA-binding NarL/FixJ family response regulator
MRVIFVGSCLAFSKRVLRFVEKEFPGLVVVRCDDIAAMTNAAPATSEPPRLVIVDEALADDLVERHGLYVDAAGTADLVLAYRQIAVARRLLENADEAQGLGSIKFLPMNLQLEVWLSVLCLLIHGETYIPAELLPLVQLRAAGIVASSEPAPAAPARAAAGGGVLTRRELDVLALVADGKSNKVIAGQLNLSEHTVKLHLHHIIAKLGVRNRTGAARWFLARIPRTTTQPLLTS